MPSSLFLGHSLGYPPQALVLPARQVSTFSDIIRHLAVISCSSSYLPLILLSVAVTPEKPTLVPYPSSLSETKLCLLSKPVGSLSLILGPVHTLAL